jgi:hypothetical protein
MILSLFVAVEASRLLRREAEHRFTFYRENISQLHRITALRLFAVAAVMGVSGVTCSAIITSDLNSFYAGHE